MRRARLLLTCALPLLLSIVAQAQSPKAPSVPPAPTQPGAGLLDPHAETIKAIVPTEVQKNLLENLSATVGIRVKDALSALQPYAGQLRVNTSLSPKYAQRFAAADKLPANEAIEAKKAIWKEIVTELRPLIEKEALKNFKESLMTYFRDAEAIVTEGQKPKLKEARLRCEKSFDKELPALAKLITEKILPENG